MEPQHPSASPLRLRHTLEWLEESPPNLSNTKDIVVRYILEALFLAEESPWVEYVQSLTVNLFSSLFPINRSIRKSGVRWSWRGLYDIGILRVRLESSPYDMTYIQSKYHRIFHDWRKKRRDEDVPSNAGVRRPDGMLLAYTSHRFASTDEMPQLAVVDEGKIDMPPPSDIPHCRSASRTAAKSAVSQVTQTGFHAISDKRTSVVSPTPSKPSTRISSTFVKGLHLDPCEAAYIITPLTIELKPEESDVRMCLLQGLAYMIGAHDTCGSVLGYFGHGRRYCRAIILDGETILFETTDEGDNLASLGGIEELFHFMGDKILPRCYGTHDKPDVKAFEDAYNFALTGLRMVLDLPLGERLCRLKAPSGESWERLMYELQMKVKYPKTREDVECMFGIQSRDIAKKNKQMHLYKEFALSDLSEAAIPSQGTTGERGDNVESQQGDKSELTKEMKTRKSKRRKTSLPEAGAQEPNTRFRDPSPSSDGRRGREMGRGASRGVDGSHQLDRGSRTREAASPEDGRNQKQSKSNENKEDVLSSMSVESADTIPPPITPPVILSKWLREPFINEPCASKAGLDMCSGFNSSPENGKVHSFVSEFVEKEEIKPPASQAVDDNEPDIPVSQRGDEEDIVDEMKRREEERNLYLALCSVLEKRGFRFLLGGQKVFQAVLKELADQYSG
ncbi:hypothetical protein I314_00054 [Cryptococcus bacillisporus CA1873]|uniref:Uncharacterized protein n=1 Tax=Cryptococcus bacillisporus CA1873 TaxID=1296111 RepID=A0ABR5BIE0_CRYGA|nr:hypothetical protein I314_00054 [Cryptococcus bacillisporus CA1873]|eukprot:KIR68953.1 hypothetical protein I314_00054 [Cryptococcus gattii CA1873]